MGEHVTQKKVDQLNDWTSQQQEDEDERRTYKMKSFDQNTLNTRYMKQSLRGSKTIGQNDGNTTNIKSGSRKAPTTLDIRSKSYENK